MIRIYTTVGKIFTVELKEPLEELCKMMLEVPLLIFDDKVVIRSTDIIAIEAERDEE